MNKIITESQLRRIVKESVNRILKEEEGIYGYPGGVDHIILGFENDNNSMSVYSALARSLASKANKGIELSKEKLANSSWMKKFQQMCFRKFGREQENLNHTTCPSLFRNYVASKMIDDINEGIWN